MGWSKEQTAMMLVAEELDRYRGRDALALETYWPSYAERFDGTLAAGEAISGEARHTFLIG